MRNQPIRQPDDGTNDQSLTTTETATRDDLEGIVDRGQQTFIEVGEALVRLRDDRLYRDTHDTFAAYVTERFGFSRSRAYQMIDTYGVSTTVDIDNEAQARALRGLTPEEMQETMRRAGEAGPVTAKSIREARPDRPGLPDTVEAFHKVKVILLEVANRVQNIKDEASAEGLREGILLYTAELGSILDVIDSGALGGSMDERLEDLLNTDEE